MGLFINVHEHNIICAVHVHVHVRMSVRTTARPHPSTMSLPLWTEYIILVHSQLRYVHVYSHNT